jgi:hypothetical protein
VDPGRTFLWACRTTWRELPAIVGLSLVWLLAATPLLVAALVGQPVLLALAGLPLAIVTTAVVVALSSATAGGPVRIAIRGSSDVTLGLICWASVVAVGWLGDQGPLGLAAGSGLGALAALVLPLALCYGAVRGRRGLAALRGGAIIATLRPGLALTIAGGLCLAAFACVASAGALTVVVPAMVGLVGCRVVRVALDDDETA